MYEELIKALRYQAETLRGMNCTTMSAEQSDEIADALQTMTAQLTAKDTEIEELNERLEADLARVTAERDAAVELLGRLDRCMMLLDASKKSLMPNPAVLHAIHFAVNAMEEWRAPAKRGEEG